MNRKQGPLWHRCFKLATHAAREDVQQAHSFGRLACFSLKSSTLAIHGTSKHGAASKLSKGCNILTRAFQNGNTRQWHSLMRPSGLPRPPELASSPAEIARLLRLWQSCTYYLPATYPHLPQWLTRKLYSIPEGWKYLMALLPKDWAIRPAFHYRVAIANAMYIQGARLQLIVPAVLTESMRKSSYAHTLAGPGPVLAGKDPEKEWQPQTPLGWCYWYFSECIKDCWRLTQLAVLFLPLVCLMPFYMNSKGPRREQWLLLLRRTLEKAGPAFIKWGQWAATRKDMFPADFCKVMESLHKNAPSHTLAATRSAIQRAFSQSMEELFEDFQVEPVASGSIGQVYKARLSEEAAAYAGLRSGTLVALKVRHPNVGRIIERDFKLMARLAGWMSYWHASQGQRLADTLQQFAGPLREQVDLALEARNLWQFNFNFRSNPHVRFPFPVYPLVTPEILVETFEEGESITRFVEEGQDGKYNKRLAELGTQAILQMMLVDNFIHQDLHPGNILVSLGPHKCFSAPISAAASRIKVPNSLPANQPRIILLDTGMAAKLTLKEQQHMVALFTAFANKDGQGVARAILEFSGDKQSCPDRLAFIDAVKKHMAQMQSSYKEIGRRSGAESLGHLLELVRQHQVNLPGQICGTVVSTLVLEGWSSHLDPNHSVINEVEHLIKAKSSPLAWLQGCLTQDALAVAAVA